MPDPTFTAGEHTFTLALSYALKRRIQRDLQVDLTDVAKGAVFQRLAGDVDKTIDVVWALVEEQAEKTHDLTRDDFEGLLDAEAIESLSAALPEAILAFSPSRMRPAIRAVIEKQDEAQTAAATRVAASIRSGALAQRVDEAIEEAIVTAEQAIPAGRLTSTSSATS